MQVEISIDNKHYLADFEPKMDFNEAREEEEFYFGELNQLFLVHEDLECSQVEMAELCDSTKNEIIEAIDHESKLYFTDQA